MHLELCLLYLGPEKLVQKKYALNTMQFNVGNIIFNVTKIALCCLQVNCMDVSFVPEASLTLCGEGSDKLCLVQDGIRFHEFSVPSSNQLVLRISPRSMFLFTFISANV